MHLWIGLLRRGHCIKAWPLIYLHRNQGGLQGKRFHRQRLQTDVALLPRGFTETECVQSTM